MEYTTQELSLEILNRLKINTQGKTSGNITVKCLSPYHIDNRPSCSISIDKGIGHCWSCGYSFNLIKLYKERTGRWIYNDLGISRSFNFVKDEEIKADLSLLPEVDFKFSGKTYPITAGPELVKKWIKKRGFNEKLLNDLNVKYLKSGYTYKKSDPDNKEEKRYFYEMIMIPIYEQNSLLCFEARQLRDKEEWAEYLKSTGKDPELKEYKKVIYPKYGSTKTLYKLSELNTDKKLYLVEGLMDTIALRTNNYFVNSTTTFGRGVKERQLYLLNRFKEVCIIPNNDNPGISALTQFKNRPNKISVLPLPKHYKDVNEVLQKGDNLQMLIDKQWLSKEKDINDFDIKTYIEALN